MPDINEIIRSLNITDPGVAALARAAGARIQALDALAREAAIASGIIDQNPAIRAAAILGMELAEAEAAALPPPAPAELDEATREIFRRIDEAFNPKKEATP